MGDRYMKPGKPGFYRTNHKGDEYRCCEANVYTDRYKQESRSCNAAALKGTRLCGTHERMRNQIENAHIWCIQLSKKGDKFTLDKNGMRKWPKYYIAKRFHSLEQAQLWANLNGNLIFNIPRVKSFCIVKFKI
jgi:hypothetical protein